MDELSRVIANLMNSLPADSGGTDGSAPPSAFPPPSDEIADSAAFGGEAGSEQSGEPNAETAGGSLGEGSLGDLASLLPNLGGGDLMGMLGAMGGGMPHDNHKMHLLMALKPYLRPERCTRVDRLCRLMDMAYGVRGALHSLGGIFHV